MTRYHINPTTNRINICRATIKCDFNVNGVEPEHFSTKEEAKNFVSMNAKKNNNTFNNTLTKNKQKRSIEDIKNDKNLTNNEKNLLILKNINPKELNEKELSHYTSDKKFYTEQAKNIKEVNSLIKSNRMEEAHNRIMSLRNDGENMIANDDKLYLVKDGLPGYLIKSMVYGRGKVFTPEYWAGKDNPETLPNSFETDDWKNVPTNDAPFVNLEQSQIDYFKSYNNENLDAKYQFHGENMSENIIEFKKRWLNGEKSNNDSESYNRNYFDINQKERAFYSIENNSNQNSYFALQFPEKDLVPVLERLNVSNVAISPLTNNREAGLVYTVMNPKGDLHSITIFEEKNYDSFVIRGCKNWDKKEDWNVPKYTYGQFSYDTPKKQAAEILGYFIKEAQEGRLESDEVLEMNAPRVDWNNILSEQIPGYSDFLKDKFGITVDKNKRTDGLDDLFDPDKGIKEN